MNWRKEDFLAANSQHFITSFILTTPRNKTNLPQEN